MGTCATAISVQSSIPCLLWGLPYFFCWLHYDKPADQNLEQMSHNFFLTIKQAWVLQCPTFVSPWVWAEGSWTSKCDFFFICQTTRIAFMRNVIIHLFTHTSIKMHLSTEKKLYSVPWKTCHKREFHHKVLKKGSKALDPITSLPLSPCPTFYDSYIMSIALRKDDWYSLSNSQHQSHQRLTALIRSSKEECHQSLSGWI